jgi:hypothetical protein
MAEVKVSWTLTVTEQRSSIFNYWNERNGNFRYSRKLNQLIKERIGLLKNNPELGKLSNFRFLPCFNDGALQHYLQGIVL